MLVGNHEKDEVCSKDLSSSSADGSTVSNKKGDTSLREDVARFVRKLFSFVDDPSCDDIVSWNETGTGFVIWDSNAFCTKVLSCYFRHTNLSSFVRQLNQYGFRKTAHSRWEFCHDSFRRGRPELLGEIKRVSVSASASSKSWKALLQTNVPQYVDYAPSFGLPFLYSATDLQMEFMDGTESRLMALQEEAKLLMRKLEESKLQCDELKLYMEYGAEESSAAKKKTVSQGGEPSEPNNNNNNTNTTTFTSTDHNNNNNNNNILDKDYLVAMDGLSKLAPSQEQPLEEEGSLFRQRVGEKEIAPRRGQVSVDAGYSSRFTSEVVYRRWVQAQLQRQAELRKLEEIQRRQGKQG